MPTPIKAYLGTIPLFDNGQSSSSYERPADWLSLPAAPAQGVHGLLAVHPNNQDRNLLAILCQAAYTVDWGDGVVEDFASNVQAGHQYDFTTLPANSLSTRGYKQVIVKVTPQAGQNLTRCFLSTRHSAWGVSSFFGYSVNWLDLNINLPNLGAGAFFTLSSTQGSAVLLERCHISSWGALNSAANLFIRCRSLQSLNETEWAMAGIASIAGMFTSCDSLRSLDCTSWNTSAVTAANSFAAGCARLESFKGKNWNLAACTTLASFFSGCSALSTCEVENWQLRQAGATTLELLFNGCEALPSLDLSAWNTSRNTSLRSIFAGCRSWGDFSSIQNWDTSAATRMDAAFSGCGADTLDLSAWNIAAVTNLADVFNALTRIRVIKFPAWPTATVTSIGSLFCTLNSSLQEFSIVAGPITFGNVNALNFNGCALSASQLNAIYSALGDYTGQTGKTIDVRNNFGVTTDNPAIATAKNWTVTG